MKEESEKADLKLNIQKTKIMAFSLIFSCQTDGEKVEVITNFIFLGSKITAETAAIKLRHFLLGRTAMKNLDSILKSRDITLQTKVPLVKAMVFLVVTYGCESWTIKKAEHHRINLFKPWCWRILFRIPWTAKRSKYSFLKEINSEY